MTRTRGKNTATDTASMLIQEAERRRALKIQKAIEKAKQEQGGQNKE